jgi:hypothetical protein
MQCSWASGFWYFSASWCLRLRRSSSLLLGHIHYLTTITFTILWTPHPPKHWHIHCENCKPYNVKTALSISIFMFSSWLSHADSYIFWFLFQVVLVYSDVCRNLLQAPTGCVNFVRWMHPSSPFCNCDWPQFPQFLLHNDTFSSPSHSLIHLNKIQSTWILKKYIPVKHQDRPLLHAVKTQKAAII